MNKSTEDIKAFLVKFHKQQFRLGEMEEEDVYRLGKFAGVFLPALSLSEGFGSFRMTESAKFGGVERSERGLFSEVEENFEFKHTANDDYADDINTLADESLRSSMAGADDTTEGYIRSDETNVVDGRGRVKPSKVVSTPPSGIAYSNFYGNDFLWLSEMLAENRSIDIEMYYELYKVMQYIRYNGASIESFCMLVTTLGANGLITIDSIGKLANGAVFGVYYNYDPTVSTTYKEQRLATFKFIVAQKFPQFVLVELNPLNVDED